MRKRKSKKNYLDNIIKRVTLKLAILCLLLNFWQVGVTGSYFVATANSSGNSVTAGDWVAPVTGISLLPTYTNTASFNLNYTATDSFSGVNYLELYISKDGGPYAKYNGNYSPGDTINFDSATTGGDGSYRFYTIGTDNATPANIEATPGVSDATTIVDTANPLANAGFDQTAGINTDVVFDGSGSSDINGIVSYKWDKDASDGVNFVTPDLTGINPTLTGGYGSEGTYTVTLQVTDNAGNTALDTMTLTVTPPSHTVTVRLFPTADNYLDEDNSSNNYGNSASVKVRSRSTNRDAHAILRFDLSVLPSTATVNSCSLNLFMNDAPAASRTHEAHLVNNHSSEWGEGSGGVAVNGESAWSWYAKPNSWGILGGDFNAAVTNSITTGTANNQWKSWNVSGDCTSRNIYSWVIKDSVEESATNYETGYRSKEQGGTADDPYLEINFTAPAVTTDHLVINEVYYDIGSGKGSDPTNEWVEIYNPKSSAVDVSGWKICDAGACDTIPVSTPIPAYGFAVITPDASTWTKWTIPPGAIQIVLGSNIGGGLGDGGDRVILKNASDAEIDKMSYGSDATVFSLPDIDTGWSLARLIKGFDTNTASDFWANNNPNPGTNPDWIPMLFVDSEEYSVQNDTVDSAVSVSEVEEASPSASPAITIDLSPVPESSPSSSPTTSSEVTPTPTPTPNEPESTPAPEPTAAPELTSNIPEASSSSEPSPTSEPEQEQSSV